ncbi:CBS domain-containing protein [Rhodococcus sp. NPDC059234]|uniref:CBS domain-containing protein n=1 Tax=Rhodococcus sp. NPDC059234 TaxID=3346781 RepID=UPI00366CF284
MRDVLTRPVVTVRPDTGLREAVALLTDRCVSSLPVVDDLGHVVGILSESDSMRGELADRGALVKSAMTTPAAVVGPAVEVGVVAERLLREHLRSIPVVEAGLLVGVVSRRDLLRTMVRDDDVIASKVRALLDDYAGSTRQWSVDATDGRVVVAGHFADEAEKRVVQALTRTVGGVTRVETEEPLTP